MDRKRARVRGMAKTVDTVDEGTERGKAKPRPNRLMIEVDAETMAALDECRAAGAVPSRLIAELVEDMRPSWLELARVMRAAREGRQMTLLDVVSGGLIAAGGMMRNQDRRSKKRRS